jgi:tetratricopeptide (TPR) repeat protein
MLGNSQAMLKRLDDAIASYHRAVATNPTNAKAWHSLGSVTLAKGDLDGAIGYYQRSIRECAVNPETWGAYGEVLRRKGRWQESADAYAQAARHTRGNLALRLERQFKSVLSLWRVGKPAPVLEQLERLRAESPDQPQVLLGLAWLKATCPEATYRNGAEALALAQRGLARGGRTIPAFEALAAAQAETGQFDQALRSAEEAQVLTIGQPDQAAKMQTIRRRADLYRAHQPFRGTEPPVDLEK